jgi:hypothetical protein
MSNSSNQYIQKTSLEHPIALWSLDDEAYYVKLMSDSGRDVENWEDVNVESILNIEPGDLLVPNPNRPCTRIVGEEVGTPENNGSAFVLSSETFSANSKPFSISFYLYAYDTDITFCNIGYQIGEEKSISDIVYGTPGNTLVYEVTSHGFLDGDYVSIVGTPGGYDDSGIVVKLTNDTFKIENGKTFTGSISSPQSGGVAFKGEEKIASDAWLGGRSNEWMLLSQTFNRNVSDAKIRIRIRYTEDFSKTFLINDVCIGQDSVQFCSQSSGQTPVPLPESIATEETHGIVAKDYLSEEKKAYYIVKDNILMSKNSSIPMAFGSSSTTKIYTNSDGPSLIFPGFGFLNNDGKYKKYNLETFLRINGSTSSPKRILGPLHSTDGIYVSGPFIVLKINNLVKTAYVGEWFKPMLVNLQYNVNSVELWVNADKLVSINIGEETISFPSKTDIDGKDQDWLGFYCDDELDSVEIDTVTIYPYVADATLIQRRLLYAQAVKTSSLENLAIQTGGKFINFRYDVAGYDKNYNFPTFSSWDSAQVFDNLSVTDNVLSAKAYSLPETYVGSKTYSEWITDQENAQDEESSFISLKPTVDYDEIFGYLYFRNQDVLGESLSSIYAVVKKIESSAEEQRLITFYDTVSNDHFKISLSGTTISYTLNISGEDRLDTQTLIEDVSMDTKISVGINLDTLRNSNSQEISNFFKRSSLSIYIGGIPKEDKTFDGKIYRVGLCNSRSSKEISDNFTNGIINHEDLLESNIATYTLFSKEFVGNFMLDIETKSYWESSVFLSNLSSYKNEVLGLDFFQINIDYPESTTIVEGDFDTSAEFVKSYISFQSNASGLQEDVFNELQKLPKNKIIDAKESWLSNQYDFTDSTIVYPPQDVSVQDVSVVIHITLISHALSYPTQIKYLELIGKTSTNSVPGIITSESSEGVEHYFINELGQEEYKANSAVFITKDSTSYLNLKNNSGVGVVNL